MTEGVVVAVIAAVGGVVGLVAAAVVTAIIAPIILRRLKAIQEQVANDHKKADGAPLNLRDDLDGKHDENRSILLTLQRDVAWIMRRVAEQDDRIDDVEDTLKTKGQTT